MRAAIPLGGLVATAFFALLAALNDGLYVRVMKVAMGLPAKTYFADWSVTPAVLSCAARGVNIYVPNTCSPLFNYSPAWLLLPVPPVGPYWNIAIGFGIAIVFLASLALLAPPRSRLEFGIRLMATLSSSVAFALERGNVDAIFFVLMLGGAMVIARNGRFHAIGYAAFIATALLKFYPAAALFVLLRERLTTFSIVVLIAVASAASLLLTHRAELTIILSHIPTSGGWTMEFNSKSLSSGLATAFARSASVATVASVLRLLFILAMAGTAILIWRWCTARGSMLPSRQTVLIPMAMGAVVILFCFLVGQNYLYRAIFLLPVLPGLFDVARGSDARVSRIIVATCTLCVAVCMIPSITEVLIFTRLWTPPVQTILWFCYQLVWWWIATVLLTVLVAFFVQSHISRLILSGIRPRVSTQIVNRS